MLKSYIAIAWRNLIKHKGYTAINITGLATGIACCLLILLYVQDEFSYDQFNAEANHIFRFTREFTMGAPMHFPYTPLPLVPALQVEFPGIKTMRLAGNGPWSLIRHEDKQFQETRIYWADSNAFSFFTFPLMAGNPATALAKPNTVVITEEMAQKYFGSIDPLGKVINVDNTYNLTVTGVMFPIPTNSHVHPDFLASFSTRYPGFSPDAWREWGSNFIYTYFMLPPDYTIERFREQMPSFLQKYARNGHENTVLHIQRLTDIHLRSHLDGELEQNGDSSVVYLFSAIALFILLIACINYMNLATARSSIRMKEIGIKKTLGAERPILMAQFMGEAMLISFVSLILGVTVCELMLPAFDALAGKTLAGSLLFKFPLAFYTVSIGLAVGLISGSYPAFVLSSFRPISMLKGSWTPGSVGRRLRQILVVSQFTVSTALIICTMVVRNQMDFIRTQKLGLDKEHVLLISIPDTVVRNEFALLKNVFRSESGVAGVGGAQITPASPLVNSNAFPPALAGAGPLAKTEPTRFAQEWIFRFVSVDEDFFSTLNIPLAAGRYFSRSFPSDAGAFIINELAAKKYGWQTAQEALGKELISGFGGPNQTTGPIVGVVNDVHFESLHEPMKPMVYLYRPRSIGSFVVKIAGGDVRMTVAALERQWHRIVPNWPFVSSFLDSDFEKLYRSDERMGTVFGAFSILAIIIACLGLIGLGAFVIEQRTKEIGVRKVLGATESQIVLLLTKDFVKLVAIAFLIASPIAYLTMSAWLQDFAYRVAIGPGIFLLAGALALLIAWFTVSSISVKAALADPATALRYE